MKENNADILALFIHRIMLNNKSDIYFAYWNGYNQVFRFNDAFMYARSNHASLSLISRALQNAPKTTAF